jgi:hypothetical protein
MRVGKPGLRAMVVATVRIGPMILSDAANRRLSGQGREK